MAKTETVVTEYDDDGDVVRTTVTVTEVARPKREDAVHGTGLYL